MASGMFKVVGCAVTLMALLAGAPAVAAPDAEQVVQQQVEAYNKGDIEAFVATYADNAALFDHPGKPWLNGRAAMRAEYGRQFTMKPPVSVTIAKRIVSGNYVVDEEIIMRAGKELGRAVATYHVTNGKIDRVDFLPLVPAPGSGAK